jgi:hypothetical protein
MIGSGTIYKIICKKITFLNEQKTFETMEDFLFISISTHQLLFNVLQISSPTFLQQIWPKLAKL